MDDRNIGILPGSDERNDLLSKDRGESVKAALNVRGCYLYPHTNQASIPARKFPGPGVCRGMLVL